MQVRDQQQNIRTTGLSARLGIAKHVASLLSSMGLEFCHNDEAEGIPEMIGRSYCGDGSVEFGGRKWEITHPITKFGISSVIGWQNLKNISNELWSLIIKVELCKLFPKWSVHHQFNNSIILHIFWIYKYRYKCLYKLLVYVFGIIHYFN